MYTTITATEAAQMIKNGQSIGLSGFTPAGAPKAVTKELAKLAQAEHEKGNEFKINLFTGASTGQSTDGDLAAAGAIGFRAPYTTNSEFRAHVNKNEIRYNDLHLSHMAQELRYGFYGPLNWGIIEVCKIEDAGDKYRVFLTSAGGIEGAALLHDVYEPLDAPFRQPIMITKVSDRIGTPYLEIDKKKVVGVVECNLPDEARSFKGTDPVTDQIGANVAQFLLGDMKRGIIPSSFLPMQSGVGTTANAILSAVGKDKSIPDFNIYTEVLQNAIVDMMLEGRVKDASTCSLSVDNECLGLVYDNIDHFAKHLTIRQSEISNSPEVIRRLGVISTQICGTKMMNGIGGSGDFERNAYISIFTCPSVAKGGLISAIVPFVSHQDHSEHDVNVVVTEQGIADLRGKAPLERAQLLIENCAHPDYRPLLREYLKISTGGHTHHNLPAAFAMHDTLRRKGDMKLTDFSEYVHE